MTHMIQCTPLLVWSLIKILLYHFCQFHPHSDLWTRLLLPLIQVLLRSPVDMRRSRDDNVAQMITTILMTGPESACANKLVMLSHYFARCRCICASLVLSHLPNVSDTGIAFSSFIISYDDGRRFSNLWWGSRWNFSIYWRSKLA